MSDDEKKISVLVDDNIRYARVAEPGVGNEISTKPHVSSKTLAVMDADSRFADLVEMVDYLSEDELKQLEKAYHYANDKHHGVKRRSGEPYIIHPIEVAIILADLHMDCDTLCAGLLHDVVEDTEATAKNLQEEFNYDVALLVEGVTKITRIEVNTLSDKQAQTLRKMFVAMSSDLRVIVIKLADRLHNMRTLDALREDRRIYKARETLEIYAPIAHRLGIDNIKWELEDLSFYYLKPNTYRKVARMVMETRNQREAYLHEVLSVLQKELAKTNITCRLMGRPKHLYSIFCKMKNKGKDFSEIYDLIAVRILVDDIKDCYAALGTVHALWSPIPGRFKDYIAMPKNNMYQSLHTSVIGPAGRPLEVQIRSEEMHKTSEYGVAAHWRYKEKSTASDAMLDKQLAWLREMVDWQDETPDSKEMLKDLRVDLSDQEVFVFTPNREVKQLRAGSTPVDFAYMVHSEVGNHCVGAKVNGSIVPLTYELKTGDRVEILTQSSAKPSRDWLGFVKTPGARSKIRSYLSKMTREDDKQMGMELLMEEVRKNGMSLSSAQAARSFSELAEKIGFQNSEELLVRVGSGKESAKAICNKLMKLMTDNGHKDNTGDYLSRMASSTGVMPKMITNTKRLTKKATHASNGIVVEGIDDVLVRLGKCCNPVPGDEIVGFVTRGRGVSVHRKNCPNINDLKNHPERMINVRWDNQPSKDLSYNINITVDAMDRMGLLGEAAAALSDLGAYVLNCSANAHKDGTTKINFLFQVSDLALVEKILSNLQKLDGVIAAYRS